MAAPNRILLDDRLLIEELLVGLPARRSRAELWTSAHWYYRACRAAVAGAGGHLSGPFERVQIDEQERSILSLLELREDVALPNSREVVPLMARIARRHPRLNLLNLEAVAAARLVPATVWLSEQSASGILPGVFENEGIAWTVIPLA